MACSHLGQLTRLSQPKLSQSVHREECTQCFDDQDNPLGIEVCLSCFNGGCLDPGRHHARTHVYKMGHRFSLNVKRKLKPSTKRAEDEEPPAKMKKLAITEEREEDKYDHFTSVKCWTCDLQNGVEMPDAPKDPKIKSLIEGVMQSMSSARQSEVKAWEEEINPCEHTLTIEQFVSGPTQASGLAHCSSCDLKENLWLCLTCGSLGCGRQQFGGVAGNGHGLAHFEASGHAISVKLGTITPEGDADIYCYICNDSKRDLELPVHLASFGINVQNLSKTEKNMTELQIEHNLKYDFSLTDHDGKALEPVFGSGLTGLANLGNSCYMASVLQTIFSLPSFETRYNENAKSHSEVCTVSLPADCVECQMHKVADGLLSGRFQQGIKPTGFKALIGKGHEEFSTMKQQDSEEFFTHLITVLRRDMQKYKDRSNQDPTTVFSYGMEQRLQCTDCKKVRYRVDNADVVSVNVPAREKGKDEDGKAIYQEVQLTDCLDSLLAMEALEYACPSCSKNVQALKQTKFASLPEVLVVHAKKFQLVNWVPAKLDIPVIMPSEDELVFTDRHLGQGLQASETELPNESAGKQGHSSGPEPNPEQIAVFVDMGFTSAQARKALRETSGNAERAVEWLFNHPDDSGEDAVSPTSGDEATPASVPGLTSVPAKYQLMAFISHRGPSVHSGHYVAHIRKGAQGDWVLFNDEKVVKADAESVKDLKRLAYLYFFVRI